jgi:hypothetical protein
VSQGDYVSFHLVQPWFGAIQVRRMLTLASFIFTRIGSWPARVMELARANEQYNISRVNTAKQKKYIPKCIRIMKQEISEHFDIHGSKPWIATHQNRRLVTFVTQWERTKAIMSG